MGMEIIFELLHDVLDPKFRSDVIHFHVFYCELRSPFQRSKQLDSSLLGWDVRFKLPKLNTFLKCPERKLWWLSIITWWRVSISIDYRHSPPDHLTPLPSLRPGHSTLLLQASTSPCRSLRSTKAPHYHCKTSGARQPNVPFPSDSTHLWLLVR